MLILCQCPGRDKALDEEDASSGEDEGQGGVDASVALEAASVSGGLPPNGTADALALVAVSAEEESGCSAEAIAPEASMQAAEDPQECGPMTADAANTNGRSADWRTDRGPRLLQMK